MSTDDAHCIGYDSRIAFEAIQIQWIDVRRQDFLLVPDVLKPLSVDRIVWSETDDISYPESCDKYGYGFMGLLASAIPQNESQGICIAISAYPKHWSPIQKEYWDALISDRDGREIGTQYLVQDSIPSPDPTKFELLGFDVADSGLISALSNCGWSPEEKPEATACWKKYLNHHHLFDDACKAQEFVEFSDKRVQEHAPFFVFGLWCRTH